MLPTFHSKTAKGDILFMDEQLTYIVTDTEIEVLSHYGVETKIIEEYSLPSIEWGRHNDRF